MKLPITIVIACTASAAWAQPVRHVPPADAEAGKDIELVAEAPATAPKLIAHVRQQGAAQFTAIELVRRDDANWVAVVPANTIAPPAIDYYVVSGDKAVFASAEWPHTMAVRAEPNAERRTRDELRVAGRRSKVRTMGEWVEYGTRKLGTPGSEVAIRDNYFRIDSDFSYRLWTYPLEEIRIGHTLLLGNTLAAPTEMCSAMGPCVDEVGFKIGGWFELGLAAVEGVRLDARLMVMATQLGFAVGGRGEARLGARDASHVAVGFEHLASVGSNGFFRLGWGTVPKLPMSATVEITNLPADHQDTGVRVYYDITREVGDNVRLGLRAGYAARNQSVGGFTGGAGASVEF